MDQRRQTLRQAEQPDRQGPDHHAGGGREGNPCPFRPQARAGKPPQPVEADHRPRRSASGMTSSAQSASTGGRGRIVVQASPSISAIGAAARLL